MLHYTHDILHITLKYDVHECKMLYCVLHFNYEYINLIIKISLTENYCNISGRGLRNLTAPNSL